MTAALLGGAWAVVAACGLGVALQPRRLPVRVGELRVAARGRRRRRPDPRLLRVGRTVLATAAPVALLPLPLGAALGAVAGVVLWHQPGWDARRRRHRREERLRAELPEIVDLLVLAVGAGLTVGLAVEAVGRRAGGDLAGQLRAVSAAVRQGHRLAEALDALPERAGEAVRPLVAALVASERYGAPLLPGLDRLAGEVRADRRRRADEAARRVSVKLLFPLVLCVLPAFALLTVAPLIAGALRSLRL